MPLGIGTYGSKKGRPSKLAKAKAKKKMSGSSKLTKAKAAKMMHEGKAHGKKLTMKQMRFMGSVASGKSKKVSRAKSRRKTR